MNSLLSENLVSGWCLSNKPEPPQENRSPPWKPVPRRRLKGYAEPQGLPQRNRRSSMPCEAFKEQGNLDRPLGWRTSSASSWLAPAIPISSSSPRCVRNWTWPSKPTVPPLPPGGCCVQDLNRREPLDLDRSLPFEKPRPRKPFASNSSATSRISSMSGNSSEDGRSEWRRRLPTYNWGGNRT